MEPVGVVYVALGFVEVADGESVAGAVSSGKPQSIGLSYPMNRA